MKGNILKNNKLIAIFLLHVLTVLILISCSLEVKDSNESKKHKKEKRKGKVENLLVAINNLKNPTKPASGKNKANSKASKQKIIPTLMPTMLQKKY